MSFDPLPHRLARALGDAASGLPVPAGRLHAVVGQGARRRLWAGVAAAVFGLGAASLIAVASAWAMGGGGGAPPDPAPAASHPDEPDTTDPPTDVAPPTTSPTGDTDIVVGTAPPDGAATTTAVPTTSPTGETDAVVGTAPPDGSATTPAPPDSSTVGTAPPGASPTTTAPPNSSTVGTAPPDRGATSAVPTTTVPPPPPVMLLDCPAHGEATDDFGAIRDNNRVHKGTDIVAPAGTPVRAVAAGTVSLRTSGPAGNAVYLTAADGTVFVYTHLAGFAPGLAEGGAVGPGDPLGTVGDTGLTNRPQLHFEIHPGGGEAIDPYLAVVAACG